MQEMRQSLAAMVNGGRQSIPSAIGPIAIGFDPSGRGGDMALVKTRANCIAHAV